MSCDTNFRQTGDTSTANLVCETDGGEFEALPQIPNGHQRHLPEGPTTFTPCTANLCTLPVGAYTSTARCRSGGSGCEASYIQVRSVSCDTNFRQTGDTSTANLVCETDGGEFEVLPQINNAHQRHLLEGPAPFTPCTANLCTLPVGAYTSTASCRSGGSGCEASYIQARSVSCDTNFRQTGDTSTANLVCETDVGEFEVLPQIPNGHQRHLLEGPAPFTPCTANLCMLRVGAYTSTASCRSGGSGCEASYIQARSVSCDTNFRQTGDTSTANLVCKTNGGEFEVLPQIPNGHQPQLLEGPTPFTPCTANLCTLPVGAYTSTASCRSGGSGCEASYIHARSVSCDTNFRQTGDTSTANLVCETDGGEFEALPQIPNGHQRHLPEGPTPFTPCTADPCTLPVGAYTSTASCRSGGSGCEASYIQVRSVSCDTNFRQTGDTSTANLVCETDGGEFEVLPQINNAHQRHLLEGPAPFTPCTANLCTLPVGAYTSTASCRSGGSGCEASYIQAQSVSCDTNFRQTGDTSTANLVCETDGGEFEVLPQIPNGHQRHLLEGPAPFTPCTANLCMLRVGAYTSTASCRSGGSGCEASYIQARSVSCDTNFRQTGDTSTANLVCKTDGGEFEVLPQIPNGHQRHLLEGPTPFTPCTANLCTLPVGAYTSTASCRSGGSGCEASYIQARSVSCDTNFRQTGDTSTANLVCETDGGEFEVLPQIPNGHQRHLPEGPTPFTPCTANLCTLPVGAYTSTVSCRSGGSGCEASYIQVRSVSCDTNFRQTGDTSTANLVCETGGGEFEVLPQINNGHQRHLLEGPTPFTPCTANLCTLTVGAYTSTASCRSGGGGCEASYIQARSVSCDTNFRQTGDTSTANLVCETDGGEFEVLPQIPNGHQRHLLEGPTPFTPCTANLCTLPVGAYTSTASCRSGGSGCEASYIQARSVSCDTNFRQTGDTSTANLVCETDGGEFEVLPQIPNGHQRHLLEGPTPFTPCTANLCTLPVGAYTSTASCRSGGSGCEASYIQARGVSCDTNFQQTGDTSTANPVCETDGGEFEVLPQIPNGHQRHLLEGPTPFTPCTVNLCTLPVGAYTSTASCRSGGSGCEASYIQVRSLSSDTNFRQTGDTSTANLVCETDGGEFEVLPQINNGHQRHLLEGPTPFTPCTASLCMLPVGAYTSTASCRSGGSGCEASYIQARSVSCDTNFRQTGTKAQPTLCARPTVVCLRFYHKYQMAINGTFLKDRHLSLHAQPIFARFQLGRTPPLRAAGAVVVAVKLRTFRPEV